MMTSKVWLISDDKDGHKSQILGVASELKNLSITLEIFYFKNNILCKFGFYSYFIDIFNNNFKNLQSKITNNNFPNILVAIGRRNLAVSIRLKQIIKKYNPNIKLIFLMPPGTTTNKNIDYIFIHKYKLNNNKNTLSKPLLIEIDFSPSKINKQLLETKNIEAYKIINELKKPIIGVMIGGKAKGVTWNKQIAKIFCNSLKTLQKQNNASLFVTTSRRTGNNITKFLKQELNKNQKTNSIYFWDFNNHTMQNPYYSILNYSDCLVVTGESTSMLAESCQIFKNTPVLFFNNSKFIGKRFNKFLDFLQNNNYACSLNSGNYNINKLNNFKKSENTSKFIANFINNIK